MLVRFKGQVIELKVTPYDDDALELSFRYHEGLKDEIKACMSYAKWNNNNKTWIVPKNHRTEFILDYLQGKPVFNKFDQVQQTYKSERTPFQHQYDLVCHGLTMKTFIWAAEMGTGKSLASIELMEHSGIKRWWFVAPKSAMVSVKAELIKWNAKVIPQLMTYEELVKTLTGWNPGDPPPEGVIFDEASRLKNSSSQRSQAALFLANNIRDYHGEKGFIGLMSGSPAPKSPLDWWSLCEIARPGFLREGRVETFRNRIALMKMEENLSQVKFPKLITYYDDEKKCYTCGKPEENELHKTDDFSELTFVPTAQVTSEADVPHKFVKSRDEIKLMFNRMAGLVKVKLKKDCLDLPEKIYRRIELTPTSLIKRTAKLVAKSAPSVAQSLILLRELSDGFQYHDKLIGTIACDKCFTKGTCIIDGVEMPCIHCGGKKVVKQYERIQVECETPKIDAMLNVLDQKEDDGRIVIYGGFTATLDRITANVIKQGWDWIRVDGRGWHNSLGISDNVKLINLFQSNDPKRIAFIGHPQSAGMGLTLTASDTILYYSNDFNAESRIQSEDRIHRIGSRGAIIIDLIHLPVDKLVLDNLQLKRELQAITMGDLEFALGQD